MAIVWGEKWEWARAREREIGREEGKANERVWGERRKND